MTNQEFARALEEHLRAEPPGVPIKALVAAAVTCARGGAPTRAGMARVGGYSYGSSQTHYAQLLTTLIERLPMLISDMAVDEIDPARASQLQNGLKDRDESIRDLRAQLADLTGRHEQLRNYALALHTRLEEMNLSAQGLAPVLHIRPKASRATIGEDPLA